MGNYILPYLSQRIATDEDPRSFRRPLCHDWIGLWKYRGGDYRLVCEIQDNMLTVLVVHIGHRRGVYL
ncbi:MAG: type II toxin-antitoxin system RelE/ParE family toxin [Desulfobacterales bacterium]|nr:type II toxin-antitoxin system RelE/ParE family toxin [Desulfobacterales bacterium]